MIPRYTRPEMGSIWSDANRFQCWLDIELALVEALEDKEIAPRGTAEEIREATTLDPERILEIEAVCKHDVIAFLTHVEEQAGPPARFVHMGLTSSDVLDTALAMQLTQATDRLLQGLDTLSEVIRRRAFEHKNTVMMGRSHGIHAEPVTFGLTMAIWYDELQRNRRRLEEARETIAVGKCSGAVGTFANTEPETEAHIMARVGLKAEPAATQVVQRDRHAHYFSVLAVIGATLEKMAVAVRHWQRTEVLEAEEPFTKGQKGSSAMPHKRNPILTENVTGLSRILRGNAMAAMENVALWHERDISHSSVERIIGPDSTILLDFMLARMTKVMDGLVVYPENMMKNLEKTGGLTFSQRLLLALVDKGMDRQAAYVLVQRNAMPVWEEGKDFMTLLLADEDVRAVLSEDEIREAFDFKFHLRHVDTLFQRVFGE